MKPKTISQIRQRNKIMSSKIVPTANPILNLCAKPNQSSKICSNLQVSRFSTRNRARCTARVVASYAPVETRETLYELLGIPQTESSISDVKKAYKEMARKYHPDVSPPERVEEYTRRFIMVHEAYETLSDPQTRASYDRDLAGGFGFSFSPRKSRQYHQETEEKGEWRNRWQSQLDELKLRKSKDKMSWASRMRNQR